MFDREHKKMVAELTSDEASIYTLPSELKSHLLNNQLNSNSFSKQIIRKLQNIN